jgi:Phosphodiester glycosidase
MAMYKPISYLLHSFLLLVLIGTSGSIVYYLKTAPSETPAVTFAPASSATPVATRASTLTPTSGLSGTIEPIPDTGWSLLQPGLERRAINIYNDQKQLVESVYIWRLDQKYFRMDVAYNETPKSLQTWQKETNAALVVNGGYFSIENERYFPDGLTIVNGKAFGNSFEGFGGMLAINQTRAELRWLVQKPYNAYEPLHAALQSFPILVKPGGQLGFPAERENNARARRTVIAQDRHGRILFIVAPEGYFTLHQLSVYLTESDLNLDIAVNLDGGGSTGILVANPREIIPSKVLLPFVILVYAR